DWAEKHLKEHLARWNRSAAAATRQSGAERRKRLAAWREERAPGAGTDDRIVQWIDRELARLADPDSAAPSGLPSVRLPRHDVRGLERRPEALGRLLRLAWLCELPEPETMPLDALKDALEARGYATDAAGRSSDPVVLDRLLPLAPEPE